MIQVRFRGLAASIGPHSQPDSSGAPSMATRAVAFGCLRGGNPVSPGPLPCGQGSRFPIVRSLRWIPLYCSYGALQGGTCEGYALAPPHPGLLQRLWGLPQNPGSCRATELPDSPLLKTDVAQALHPHFSRLCGSRRTTPDENKFVLGRASPSQTLPGGGAWVRGPPARVR